MLRSRAWIRPCGPLLGRSAYFHASARSHAASNFAMPAMSPTMTEGNIANWKMKEGDTFVAGDVILEIETDKATMDVEAQDDGILAKILVGDGKKGVAVGTNIAVMAEAGDDVSKLDMPQEKVEKSEPTKPSSSKGEPIAEKDTTSTKPEKTAKKSEASHTIAQTNKDGSALSPAVQFLLAQHGITDAHAIRATGPKSRLLKGDILAYVKEIDAKSTVTVADACLARSKLDLSNIKKAPMPTKPASAVEREAPVIKNPVIEIRQQVNLNHLILLTEKLSEESGIEITVEELTAKAAERALQDFPLFGLSQPSSYDQIFEEVVTGRQSRPAPEPSRLAAQKPSPISLDVAEYFEGGPIKLPSRAPASTFLTLQAATPAPAPAPDTRAAEYDLIDFLTDRPLPRANKSTSAFASRDLPSSMIASLSFKEGSVDIKNATIYLDRVSQYVESPSHLFL